MGVVCVCVRERKRKRESRVASERIGDILEIK
jgi:hypothetical protein